MSFPAPTVPDAADPDTVIDAATSQWVDSARHHYPTPTATAEHRLIDWEAGSAPDGAPLVSARVVGPNPEKALHQFAGGYLVRVGDNGQRPTYDLSDPDVTAVVWRTEGVWVRLWAPEARRPKPSAPTSPRPATKPAASAIRPSARLPFRRNTTPKGV
ncbi:hypothetical protein [Streptomyces sp. NPDC093589]|uniref:hypothetical protein n=1 Tax=Streptomyces sp. NPDC093589 TaxID=3366043 RepID=UPI003818C968